MTIKSTSNYAPQLTVAAFACLFACSCQMASAQKSGASIVPTQFMGKSFEDCEKILGKPRLVENPTGQKRGFSRYYKTSVPNLTRIVLERLPQGSMSGPVAPTVNVISYGFPASVTKWQDALKIIGISSDKVQAKFDAVLTLPDGSTCYWFVKKNMLRFQK